MDGHRSLVVGSAGQIGSAIRNLLGLERSFGSSTKPGEADVTLDLATVAARAAATSELSALDFDALYCVAGFTDVERCESERDRAFAVNAHGPAVLARLAAERGIPFVYFSTDYVFDGIAGPYTEDAVPHPICVYGESKLLGEHLVLEAYPQAIVIRTTVVYGPDPRGKNFVYSLARALRERRTLRVPIDQIGTPTYNRDVAKAAIELVKSCASGTYHAAGPDLLSRYDFALEIAAFLGASNSAIEGVSTTELAQVAPRPLRAGLCTGKIRAEVSGIAMRDASSAMNDWAALGGLP